MLLSSILLVPTLAHAATGTVSVNGGNQIVTAQTATTVSVPIQIQGSDPLDGFDIQVFANPAILSGASISLTGSLLASPKLVIECINGVLVFGPTCAPQDGAGVVHLQVVQLGANIANIGTPDTLFTINYNIVGTSASTPISFNTGCSGTSVSGVCVTISNGTTTPLSETAVNGSFANLNDFSITPTFTKISTPAGTPISDVINYAALGAFSDTLTETLSGSGASHCSLATMSVNLAFFPTGSDTLTCSSLTTGDFSVNVTATGSGSGISHSAVIDLLVAPAGFGTTLNQNFIHVSRGTSDSTTIATLTGVSGFSGTVTVTVSSPTGITGTASPSMVTLTPDASGYSSGTTTLTISVGATTASGNYTLSITGGATLIVNVPISDFTLSVTPAAESIPRGSTAAATINLASTGSFSGTVTLTATVTGNALDNDGVNNIVSSFLPVTVTLTSGGSGGSAFFASTVKIGFTPNPANTATGNYSATITATSGSITHTVTLIFLVQDFVLGPNFCPGNTPVFGTPDGEYVPAFIGQSCNSFTLTTQTVANGGAESNLYVQVNSLGGLQTNGATFLPGIQSGDPTGPSRGRFVPELGFKICFFQTFFANGTQIAPSFLQANGPIVRGDPTDGCRGDGEAFPNDVAGTTANNIDFFAVTADSLSHTLPGTYLVNVCGQIGTLVNCDMVTLIVIRAPHQGQAVFSHKVSISAGGVWTFKGGITNLSTVNIFAQLEITGIGSLGDTFSQTTATVLIAPGASANNLGFSVQFTSAEIGEKFTFTTTIIASAVDSGSVLVSMFPAGNNAFNGFFPPFTASGTSTLQSTTASFTVVA
jgi:hypothetical protein